MSMNRNEERSLIGAAPAPVNSRHVIEDMVLINTFENAPQTLNTTTPVGTGLRSRFMASSGTQPQHRDVTARRRIIQGDTAGAEQRLLRFQLETETAETELQAERTASAQLQVTQLATAMAELQARTAAAEEALASSRQRLHDLQRQSTSPRTPPKSPCSSHGSTRVRSPSPPTDFAALLQLSNRLQQQAAGQLSEDEQRRADHRSEDDPRREDQRREDEQHEQRRTDQRRADEQQRREDEQRRADQRREERREDDQRREDQRREDRREAAEREARIDARQATHTPQANSSSMSSDPGFTSNKSFAGVPLFSGENEQPFNPWTVEFLAPAEVVGDAHDNLRELRLKLRDPARAYLNRRYPTAGAEQPDLLEALAYLASEFGPRYEESQLMAGYYKYQRKRGDTGNDVMRALTAARERIRAAGIPAVRDEAEDHYYVLEWSLTAAQRTLFLSQLSADRDASDACLKSLTGASDASRRGSFAPAPASSDARTQLFKTRVERLEAFLVHDKGADGHGGTARAATTTGTPGDPAAVADPAPQPPYGDRAAVVLRLKAQHTTRGAAADKPPPRYYGTAERPETQRNAATFAARKAAQACFGCTPAQLAAQGDIPHWECRHHGQDASDADRSNRVPGSGPERLSDGPGPGGTSTSRR